MEAVKGNDWFHWICRFSFWKQIISLPFSKYVNLVETLPFLCLRIFICKVHIGQVVRIMWDDTFKGEKTVPVLPPFCFLPLKDIYSIRIYELVLVDYQTFRFFCLSLPICWLWVIVFSINPEKCTLSTNICHRRYNDHQYSLWASERY